MSASTANSRTAALTPRQNRLSLAAVITCISVAGIAMGGTLPLLAFLMERMGTPSYLIGLNTAVPALATLLATPFMPAFMHRIGIRRFLLLCILVSATILPVYHFVPNVWFWFPLRFVHGAAISGLFVASEFWILRLADRNRRGKIIGIYGTAFGIGFAAGPLLLVIAGTTGLAPFAAMTVAVLLAAIPVLLVGRSGTPAMDELPRLGARALIRAAPATMLAAMVYGAIETNSFNMLPLYALRIGTSETMAALALSIFALGHLAGELPLGLLADRFDRRRLLAACALTCLLVAAGTPFATGLPIVVVVALFTGGAALGGIYIIGLTGLGERFDGAELAGANATFIMLYSVGALLAPPVAGIAMDWWDPHGLILVLSAICCAYLLLLGWRLAVREQHKGDRSE